MITSPGRCCGRCLEKEGYAVVEADHGQQALVRMAEQVPELILLDLLMPEMDGFAFVEEVRTHEAWRSIPIVVTTAKDLTEEDRLQLNGYVEQILQKGMYNRGALLQRFRQLVATRLGYPPTQPSPSEGGGLGGVRLRRAVHSPAGVDEPASEVRKRDFYLGCWVALSGERTRGMPKILLVEDNEMNRDMLSRRLERRGYQVIIAVDGQEVWHWLSRKDPTSS